VTVQGKVTGHVTPKVIAHVNEEVTQMLLFINSRLMLLFLLLYHFMYQECMLNQTWFITTGTRPFDRILKMG